METMRDIEKLNLLANLFDVMDSEEDNPNRAVQHDLRRISARLATLEAHVAAGRELAERIEVIHDSDDPLSWIEIDPDDWKNILAHLDGPDTKETPCLKTDQ